MRILVCFAFAAIVCLLPAAGAAADMNPNYVDAYVTPYYNSDGPQIHIGTYSTGLASKDDRQFVATIHAMKQHWNQLSFYELYVAAIQLYDAGYRNESVYWFYTAQYRGRQFGVLVDQNKLGSIGSPGFELFHAQDAFFQLAGPWINGYAFGHPDMLTKVVRRVQAENRNVPDLHAVYPGVTFVSDSQWKSKNASLNSGMDKLVTALATQADSIHQQRVASGADARFAGVTSKDLP